MKFPVVALSSIAPTAGGIAGHDASDVGTVSYRITGDELCIAAHHCAEIRRYGIR